MPKPDIYDPAYVKGVFDRCSGKYIAFSYVCSLGFTERWRKQCVAALGLESTGRFSGYDLMAGTGEAWPHLIEQYAHIDRIIAVDISSGMHQRAMDRLHQMRAHKIDFVEDDVLASNLATGSADFIISTFGLKTFNPTQHEQLAQLVANTLRSGGKFSFIEASDPKGWWLRPLYLFYLKAVLPLVERLFLRGAKDFSMIGQYSTNFGNASDFAEMLRRQGLKAEFRKYFFGCATGVVGSKP
jgi:ubiquinone/menaquinone biosynthesis C-methylase UbiE